MKTIDILKQKHTVLGSTDGYHNHQDLIDYTQTDMSLEKILFDLSDKYKESIGILRQMEYHSDKQNKCKKEFPTWFVGGTFPFKKTEDKDIISYTNILCIDIDKKDNPDIDMDMLKKEIFSLPYVVLVSNSITGQGIYVLILVENGKYTQSYYSYLIKLFNKKYGVIVDKQCKNIGRKRYISYDDNLMIKDNDYDVQSWKLKDIIVTNDLFDNKQTRLIDYKPNISNNSDFTRKAIWKLLDNGFSVDDYSGQNDNYGAWYHTACEFAHFDDGYDMFVRFSQNSSKYNDDINTINKKWKNADKNKKNIDDISKKWCGMCKNRYGRNWWKT